jgi:hypothetical protein
MCPRCTRLERADFEPFVRLDEQGRARFANRFVSHPGRFRDRQWPVFQRPRRRVWRRRPCDAMRSVCSEKVYQSIRKAARLAEARRLVPLNPLLVHALRVEDPLRGRGRSGEGG